MSDFTTRDGCWEAFIDQKKRADALEAQLAEANARVEALTDALRTITPLMENLESKLLVGDEGCIWAAEIVRAALLPLPTPPKGEVNDKQ